MCDLFRLHTIPTDRFQIRSPLTAHRLCLHCLSIPPAHLYPLFSSLFYSQYEGTWSKGVRSGEGELQYENLKFVGGFTDDQPLGAGRFLFKAGYMQPGEFVMAGDQAEDEEEEAKPTTKWVGKPVMVAQ